MNLFQLIFFLQFKSNTYPMGSNIDICHTHQTDVQSQQTIQQLDFQENFQKLEDNIKLPPISQELSDLLAVKKPFLKELNSITNPKKINHKGNVYVGQVSKFRSPNGWGKMFCSNGDIIISQFSSGEMKGKHFYAKRNGTYIQGQIQNGKLTCQNGIYYCAEFQYIGGFKDNLYHGMGRILKDNFVLQGEFDEGRISYGKLEWNQNRKSYIYIGNFNEQMEMHGKGVLEQPFGTFTGEFRYNKKEGDGVYKYLNGNYFKGHYVCGKKKGYGQLYSTYDEVLYRGEWANDIPQTNVQLLTNNQYFMRKKQKCPLKRVESLKSTKTQKTLSSVVKI